MLVILRMNRNFMEFMREHYNHLTKDHFGKTIISDTIRTNRVSMCAW